MISILSKKILIVLIILIVLGCSLTAWFVYKYKQAEDQTKIFTRQNQELNQQVENAPNSNEQDSIAAITATTSFLKTYQNAEWGFEFQYPENWKLEENSFYSPFSKFNLIGAPSGEDFLPNSPFLINIVTPDFIERQFPDLRNIASKITVAKIEGLKYEYKEQKLSYVTIILPFGQYKMILSTTKAYENVFNQILAAFEFLGEVQTYRNEQYGFKFQYPKDWATEESPYGSPASKFNLIVVPVVGGYLPDPVLINIVTLEFANVISKNLNGEISSNVTVANVNGVKYEYKFEVFDEIAIVLPFGEYQMILGAKKQYEDVLDQNLASFKFLK